jgi:F1F0 ATPase subunit 2
MRARLAKVEQIMTAHEALVASLRLAVPLLAAAGFLLGIAYFASLRRGVELAVARSAWSPYMLLALARIAATALFFTFAARWGVPSLLAPFAGFLAARQLAVRAARRLA